MENKSSILFVKSTTPTKQLASSIVLKYESEGAKVIVLRSIGAGSIAQCTYGILVAKGILEKKGKSVSMDFKYVDVINTRENKDTKPKITAVEYTVSVY